MDTWQIIFIISGAVFIAYWLSTRSDRLEMANGIIKAFCNCDVVCPIDQHKLLVVDKKLARDLAEAGRDVHNTIYYGNSNEIKWISRQNLVNFFLMSR